MSKIYAFVCFIFCSVTSLVAASQTTFTVRGVVQDEETGELIAFANVIEKGTQNGTTTDFEGEFALKVEKLPVDIVVQYVGYPSQEVRVDKVSDRIVLKMKMK